MEMFLELEVRMGEWKFRYELMNKNNNFVYNKSPIWLNYLNGIGWEFKTHE